MNFAIWVVDDKDIPLSGAFNDDLNDSVIFVDRMPLSRLANGIWRSLVALRISIMACRYMWTASPGGLSPRLNKTRQRIGNVLNSVQKVLLNQIKITNSTSTVRRYRNIKCIWITFQKKKPLFLWVHIDDDAILLRNTMVALVYAGRTCHIVVL